MNWFKRKPKNEIEIEEDTILCPNCSHLLCLHLLGFQGAKCVDTKHWTEIDSKGFKRLKEEKHHCDCDLSQAEILLNLNIEKEYNHGGEWQSYTRYFKTIDN